MPFDALLLVVAGALLHAVWNLSAKQAGGGTAFIWAFNAVSVAVTAPLAVVSWQPVSLLGWAAIGASALIHIGYNLALLRGYRDSEFSVVYPTARGTGPLFAVLGALLLFGERPSALGALGIASIVLGLFLLGGGRAVLARGQAAAVGVRWGALTGVFIAGYTLTDAWAVTHIGVPVALYYCLGLLARTLMLAPGVLRAPSALRACWRDSRRHVLVIGVCSPLAYLLVLQAMTMAPLSYVAPLREMSMLIGVVIGARVLREALTPTRLLGAVLMLAGVSLLAMA
ncbi:DMT family transporter [Denitromonas iodatirespirans]|uniref:EamA family transporter n=1 Tax=Denitromonas iodatirespirans TaxID=2795389 RepID=A0A944DDY3_DENI1|nr:DMT family transporter [Denitromonas iodatirespirans]MBT0963732.1 EamA family transporter [Denitromonas iodatirespirans]